MRRSADVLRMFAIFGLLFFGPPVAVAEKRNLRKPSSIKDYDRLRGWVSRTLKRADVRYALVKDRPNSR
jgi:hypothetical protein